MTMWADDLKSYTKLTYPMFDDVSWIKNLKIIKNKNKKCVKLNLFNNEACSTVYELNKRSFLFYQKKKKTGRGRGA